MNAFEKAYNEGGVNELKSIRVRLQVSLERLLDVQESSLFTGEGLERTLAHLGEAIEALEVEIENLENGE